MKRRFVLAALLAPLFWGSLPETGFAQPKVKLTLLHLNDVYEYNAVDDGRKGSFPRIQTLQSQFRAKNPNTIFILAGDTISPSVASSLFRGGQMIAMWNAVHLDIACLGNHEFDFGPEVLKQRMKESKFSWISANVLDRKTGQIFGGMPEFIVRDIGGAKVGFFGLLTPDTGENSNSGPDVVFADPIETGKKVVADMRAQGVQYVVAVTHLNLEDDKRLARAAHIDLILGGHEHVLLESLVDKTPIFKWGSDARVMGKIDLTMEPSSGKLTDVDWEGVSVGRHVNPDAKVQALVTTYEKQLSGQLELPVATSEVELDGRASTCRRKESNLGNFVADALRSHYQADVAVITGSSIRIDRLIPAGVITRRTAIQMMPYENPVDKVSITGRQLRALLEHCLSTLIAKNNRFPQVSGLVVKYDPKKPVGSRVVSLSVGDQPAQDDKVYTLACSEFIRKGGSGFSMLPGLPRLKGPEDAPSESAVLIEALLKQKKIAPKLEGRIISL